MTAPRTAHETHTSSAAVHGGPPYRVPCVVTALAPLALARSGMSFVLVGSIAGLLLVGGCYQTIDQKTAAAVIQRDLHKIATWDGGPYLRIEMTGYIVNPFEEQKFELMKSLPELFTLQSIQERTAHFALEHLGNHYELLPLVHDRGALVPVPGKPERLLRHYEFALSNPALTCEEHHELDDRRPACLPLTNWEIRKVTLSFLQLGACHCADVVATKSPNASYRLIAKALTKRPPWFAFELEGRLPVLQRVETAFHSRSRVCFVHYSRWETVPICK